MNKDLITAILVAIVGIAISYFVCNLFYGDIPPYTFSTIQETVSADLTEPDSGIFNYRAINPTVEVYVGNCDGSEDYEKCINESSDQGQISEDVVNEGQDSDNSANTNKESSKNSSSSDDSTTKRGQ